MRRVYFLFCILQLGFLAAKTQNNLNSQTPARVWADSVFNSLTQDQRIAQLMVLRLSAYDFKTKTPIYYDKEVAEAIKKYNVGGICPFQGNPVQLAEIINYLQSIAQTPLMTCIDAEWGIGMRLIDSVTPLPPNDVGCHAGCFYYLQIWQNSRANNVSVQAYTLIMLRSLISITIPITR